MFNDLIKKLNKKEKLSVKAHKRYLNIYAKKYMNEKANKKENFSKMEYHKFMIDEIIKNGKPSQKKKNELLAKANRIANSYYK